VITVRDGHGAGGGVRCGDGVRLRAACARARLPVRLFIDLAIGIRKRPVVPTPILDANCVGRPDIVFWERRDRRCFVWQHGSGSVSLQSLWW